MRDQQTANIALSMLVDIYLGVFESFPKFNEMIQEHKKSSYYEEIVSRDIDFCNNMTYILPDRNSEHFIRVKLQEKGIPFIESNASPFSSKIKANGPTIFFLREADYERAVEATKEVEKEWEAKREAEKQQEEEWERTREEEISAARARYEKSEDEAETGPDSADQPAQEDGLEKDESGDNEPEEDEGSDKKKKGKDKNRSSSRKRNGENSRNRQQERERDRQRLEAEQRRQNESSARAERDRTSVQEATSYSDKERTQYAKEEDRLREQAQQADEEKRHNYDRDRNRRSQEESEKRRGELVEKETSRDGNRYKSMDYHNRTIASDGSGYEERKQEQERNTLSENRERNASGAGQDNHNYRHANSGGRNEGEYQTPTATSETQAYSPSEPKRKEPYNYSSDGNSGGNGGYGNEVHPDEHGVGSGSHYDLHAHNEKTSAAPKESAGSIRMGGWGALETGRHPSSAESEKNTLYESGGVTVLGNGNSIPENGGNVGSVNSNRESLEPRLGYGMATQGTAMFGGISSSIDKLNHDAGITDASAADLKSFASAADRNIRISVGRKMDEGELVKHLFQEKIEVGDAPMFSDFSKQVLNSGYANDPNTEVIFTRQGGHTQCVIRTNITSEIMANRRINEIAGVGRSKHINNLVMSTRRLVTNSVISRESDAGRVTQETGDIASPAARGLLRQFLHGGAIQLNMDTPLSLGTMVAAYSTASGLDMAEARRQIIAFTLGNSKTGNIGMWSLGEFEKATGADNVGEFLKGGGPKRFNEIIRQLSEQGLHDFISKSQVSRELGKHLLGFTRQQLNDPELYASLLKKFSDPKDQAFLKQMRAGCMENKYGVGSFSGLIQRYILQIFKRMARTSDAGRAWMDIYASTHYIYSAHRAGMKLMSTALGKLHIINPDSLLVQRIVDPKAAMQRAAANAFARTKPGNAVVSRFGKSARKQLRARAVGAVRSRILRVRTVRTVTAFVKNMKIVRLAGNAGKVVTQVASKIGAMLGWIALIAVILILLLEFAQNQIKAEDESNTGISSYITAQDTEILQEVITELTAKNEQFMVDINNAANHRGNYAVSSGVTANENVSFYESYTVIFRDSEGNILEPSHVDLNNTKAIISMATRFMPYPFTKLSENASEKEKKEYEDLKQHFKDYCYFLWAATHQISIEEYHPGDENYSEYDTSELETTLDRGICDKDGTTIWLPENFVPNTVTEGNINYVCETCSELPEYSSDYGYALCTHGKDANPIDGWRMTGNTRDAINCHTEHHENCDHSEDDYDCHYCDEVSIEHVKQRHKPHYHLEYEWVYECGGHMGNVVYVTIGDLSRIPGFPAAGDVDYGSVAVYLNENAGESQEEQPTESAEPVNGEPTP